MNYSVLVLGASISISLFIRICCSLEGNLDQREDLYTGSSDEVYAKLLKHFLQSSVRESGAVKSAAQAEKIFNDLISTVNSFGHDSPTHTRTGPSGTKSFWSGARDENDYVEICGNTKPPPVAVIPPICDSEERLEPEGGHFSPGCSIDRETKIMLCQSENITRLPYIPHDLESLTLTQTGIQNLTITGFKNKSINRITLVGNEKIDYIHPWTFKDVNGLTSLFIVGNQLKYLAYDIYVGLEDTIFLDLKSNQISLEIYRACPTLPVDQINLVLPKLRVLDLSGNPLTTIPAQMFAGLRESSLYSLFLQNAHIRDIDEEAFVYLKNLAILNLSDNPSALVNPMDKLVKALEPLESLKSLYLAGLGMDDSHLQALHTISTRLENLDLNNNKIHTIKRETFSKFSNLKSLNLDKCAIQNIEEDAFTDMVQLTTLTLHENEIKRIPYFPFSLIKLSISNNRLLQNVADLRVQNLTKLESLNITAINLHHLSKDMFTGLPNLFQLIITNCGVESIEAGTFHNLTDLRSLTLNDNPISDVEPSLFIGLKMLESLSLRNVSFFFKTTDAWSKRGGPFNQVSTIKHLNLENNQIDVLSPVLFDSLKSLCYIYLKNNPIESWDVPVFPDRESVYDQQLLSTSSCFLEMNLQNSKIERIKDAMLDDFSKVSIIDLSGAGLLCDKGACRLRDMINSSLSSYKQTWVDSEKYKCKHPETGESLDLLSVTDEICNKAAIESPNVNESPFSPFGSSFPTTIVAVFASLTVISAVIIVLAYRHRAHLKYFWFSFKFKFNVSPLVPRKAKLSAMEVDPVSSYDFDVFISYHHDDSRFIADVFLPEIEVQGSEVCYDTKNVVEAKNSMFFEEDSKIMKNVSKNDSIPRFKVCLHERDFAAGVPITENIVDCVDRSRKTVIFVSNKYMESQWCTFELNLAYHRLVESRRKSFLLVFMEEIPAKSRGKVLHYLMASTTYLQWPGFNGLPEEKDSFWKRLRSFLQS